MSNRFEKPLPAPERERQWYKDAKAAIMKHGGRRKGAGRKPRSKPREPVTVRLEPEHAARFRAICEAKKRSQSEQITEWIERAKI